MSLELQGGSRGAANGSCGAAPDTPWHNQSLAAFFPAILYALLDFLRGNNLSSQDTRKIRTTGAAGHV